MPVINVTPKTMLNGDVVTSYSDTVGTSSQTFTFQTTQETVILRNKGTKPISYTIGSNTGSIDRSEFVKVTGSFSSVQLTASQGTQAFEIWAEEAGTSQSSGGSGILVYPDLTALQLAYPNGVSQPVWVDDVKKWYYWTSDGSTGGQTPPSSSSFLTAAQGGTISWSTNTGQRGGGVTAKQATTITKVGVKGGASGAWSLWKLDNTTFNITTKLAEGTTLAAPDSNGYRLSGDISIAVSANDNLLLCFTYATGIDASGTYRYQTGSSANSDTYFQGNNRIINPTNGVPQLNDVTSTGYTYDMVIYHT